MGASCAFFSSCGSFLCVGFDDGCVRFYTTQTGTLINHIVGVGVTKKALLGCVSQRNVFPQVHPEGVTAVCELRHRSGFLSGGSGGHLRLWASNSMGYNRSASKPRLQCTVREHKMEVTTVRVTKDEQEAVTASKDGSCIIWDLRE